MSSHQLMGQISCQLEYHLWHLKYHSHTSIIRRLTQVYFLVVPGFQAQQERKFSSNHTPYTSLKYNFIYLLTVPYRYIMCFDHIQTPFPGSNTSQVRPHSPPNFVSFFSCSQINIFDSLIRTALTLQINLGNKDIVITLILFMIMRYFTIHLFSLIAFINDLQHSVHGSFISLVIFILEYFGQYYKQDYFLGHHQYVETLLIFDFVSYCFTRFIYLKKFQEYLQNFLYME